MIYSILTDQQVKRFEATCELNAAIWRVSALRPTFGPKHYSGPYSELIKVHQNSDVFAWLRENVVYSSYILLGVGVLGALSRNLAKSSYPL
jgi:hypothetical protein